MSSVNPNYHDYATLNSLIQKKTSDLVASLVLVVVLVLHALVIWHLSNMPKTHQEKPPVLMEVVMSPKPEPVVKQTPKESLPALPPAQKKTIKPKPVVKPPEPIKKPVAVKKRAPAPKPQPTEVKEVIPVPKFEPAPKFIPAPPVAAPAPATTSSTSASSGSGAKAKASGHGRGDSNTVVSGVVPLVRVPPKYPPRAASRHIEGWVKIEFTIKTDGSVDHAAVVGAEPPDIFDDAALTAISKWKFKEKIVNGVAVPQRAVQRLQFKLEQ